jgi:hypothetical protein
MTLQVPASRMLLASDPVYPRALGDIHPHDPVPRMPSHPRRFYVVVVGIKIGVFYDTLRVFLMLELVLFFSNRSALSAHMSIRSPGQLVGFVGGLTITSMRRGFGMDGMTAV